MVNFGKKLKTLRNQAGMTQSDLAKKLGVTKTTVSYYELSERYPSPEILKKLALVFHVSTDYLLDIDHKKTLDVSDLSDDDISYLTTTVEILRKKRKR